MRIEFNIRAGDQRVDAEDSSGQQSGLRELQQPEVGRVLAHERHEVLALQDEDQRVCDPARDVRPRSVTEACPDSQEVFPWLARCASFPELALLKYLVQRVSKNL